MNNRLIFRRIPLKRGVMIALIATLAIGTTVFAAGKIASIVSSSSVIPTYYSMPSADKINKDLEFEPKLVEKFDTGYEFKSGHEVKNEIFDDNGNSLGEQEAVDFVYNKGEDKISLNISKGYLGEDSQEAEHVGNYRDISLSYLSSTYKVLPEDYKMTEQDKKDKASGKYIFSSGSDKVEISEFKQLSWTQNGISYMFTAMDSDVTQEQLVKMAHQMIDSL
ncbi:hypothetical protein [Metaclostridioides mangenotii]|uniref:Uncharacterized protein n=1 Tax=Metaclostridioides mangenotii TaxID=1540 RepID=A0ABS4EBG0_9FIRM|nr:hypothetical protein [Clostridioides mangenotii]MBP1855270.1 hypothetical protein [Clostridioides mangenotii]